MAFMASTDILVLQMELILTLGKVSHCVNELLIIKGLVCDHRVLKFPAL